MLEYLRRLIAHLRWADEQVLERLRAGTDERALRLFAHILGAEKVWLTRLGGKDSRELEVWPTLDLEGCVRLAGETHAWIERYLDSLDEEQLWERLDYRNQLGEPFTNRRIDILTHFVTHGVYHRGQIAQSLRAAGHEPVPTDFIVWARGVE
jgi:uncharacterized damage-inducible protein DinB